MGRTSSIAISSNGQALVYAAGPSGGTTRLFYRPTDSFVATPIEGTEGAQTPFFSPDGEWVGFFSGDALYRVGVAGGQPVEIARTRVYFPSATWGPDDTIIFSDGTFRLMQVQASGGEPRAITIPDPARGETRHLAPQFLPGGQDVLFTISMTEGESQAAVLSLQSGEWRTVQPDAASARYAPTGHLVFAQDSALLAIPFDLDRMETGGSPIPTGGQVSYLPGLSVAHFALSDTGTLVYASDTGVANTTLVWVDRKGQTTPLGAAPAPYWFPRISPDGGHVAVTIPPHLWVYDVERGGFSPLTRSGFNLESIWNPDGRSLKFSSVRTDPAGFYDLYSVPVDRSTEPQRVLSREGRLFPTSWSADGQTLGFYEQTLTWDIGLFDDDTAALLLDDDGYDEDTPVFSPNGRWLAYASNESGRYDVYVRPYPGPGGSRLILNDGGSEPMWSRDGRELFYRDGDLFMRVPAETTETNFPFGTPEPLFEGRFAHGPGGGGIHYDVHPDGDRFLMIQPPPDAGPSEIRVITNWFEELRRLVPTN